MLLNIISVCLALWTNCLAFPLCVIISELTLIFFSEKFESKFYRILEYLVKDIQNLNALLRVFRTTLFSFQGPICHRRCSVATLTMLTNRNRFVNNNFFENFHRDCRIQSVYDISMSHRFGRNYILTRHLFCVNMFLSWVFCFVPIFVF